MDARRNSSRGHTTWWGRVCRYSRGKNSDRLWWRRPCGHSLHETAMYYTCMLRLMDGVVSLSGIREEVLQRIDKERKRRQVSPCREFQGRWSLNLSPDTFHFPWNVAINPQQSCIRYAMSNSVDSLCRIRSFRGCGTVSTVKMYVGIATHDSSAAPAISNATRPGPPARHVRKMVLSAQDTSSRSSSTMTNSMARSGTGSCCSPTRSG